MNDLSPSRGIICGLILATAMWLLIFAIMEGF